MGELRENGCSECRLVREDGSEWVVTDFDLSTVPPQVNASRPGSMSDNGEDTAAGRGGPASEETNATPEIRRETLAKGDRLEWLGEDGRVIWSFKSPLNS